MRRTRSGTHGDEAVEQLKRIEAYNKFVKSYFGDDHVLPVTRKRSNQSYPIKFKDGTEVNDFPLLPAGDMKYTAIKFKLHHLVDDNTYQYINKELVNKYHYMKLKLSKIFFGFIIFKYDLDSSILIDLCHEISLNKSDLSNFIRSMANAMNGNYVYQSTKETWLHDYDLLTFIVDYMKEINEIGNQIPMDEIIKKNGSTTQIIQYISDQMSVDIVNCIKKNTKTLIRIYIEYMMQIKQEKKKICRQGTDINLRNTKRTALYNQRKIIQSVIFQYPIEVLLTYFIYIHYYIIHILFNIFLFYLGCC